jgi:hypothetical protein
VSISRMPDETFEDYKARRALEHKATANRLVNCPVLNDVPHRINEEYGISRDGYLEMLANAKKEYKDAVDSGLTDEEILGALKSGTLGQQLYAKFIENEVIGKVKHD